MILKSLCLSSIFLFLEALVLIFGIYAKKSLDLARADQTPPFCQKTQEATQMRSSQPGDDAHLCGLNNHFGFLRTCKKTPKRKNTEKTEKRQKTDRSDGRSGGRSIGRSIDPKILTPKQISDFSFFRFLSF